MAYRRRQQVGREAPPTYNYDPAPPSADSSSLAAKAIRASSAHRESSLSSVYEQSALSSPRQSPRPSAPSIVVVKESSIYEPPPKKDVNESKQGFWGGLARKAKAIIDDDNPQEIPRRPAPLTFDRAQKDQNHGTYTSSENRRKTDNPSLQKGLDAITSSLNYIGGTIGNALEEGITAVENRTADIIQETRKIQIRKKSGGLASPNETQNPVSLRQPPMPHARVQPQINADLEMQLKASRDVAMAMAAKAKLLLRELKTVKADLAFAKERCGQLEEENRFLRESREKGDNPEDDDLIRLQLESLLAEKSRLAQENSVYARENRFLREIVEYHQLTMQDVVYLDEGSEEMTEVYPIKIPSSVTNAQLFGTMTPLTSPTPTIPHGAFSQGNKGINPSYVEINETSEDLKTVNPYVQMTGEDSRRY